MAGPVGVLVGSDPPPFSSPAAAVVGSAGLWPVPEDVDESWAQALKARRTTADIATVRRFSMRAV
ncbi:hypothetical protein KILIM_011_00510 [Kineosphaera limosa NBRC 100340]|uniref:Uncharacterized protein n=1 Tax=Kineosphaera limosa NBRC 100340 TaxID=1184609 RepID=K6VF12_9MICO|nr:hypothetical protein KILIM_011_00510 [Kineosphaera limosa NBRC 100340]